MIIIFSWQHLLLSLPPMWDYHHHHHHHHLQLASPASQPPMWDCEAESSLRQAAGMHWALTTFLIIITTKKKYLFIITGIIINTILVVVVRGALKLDFWKKLGFCPNWGGGLPIPNFDPIFQGCFCCNMAGVPQSQPTKSPKMWLFHEKIICLE